MYAVVNMAFAGQPQLSVALQLLQSLLAVGPVPMLVQLVTMRDGLHQGGAIVCLLAAVEVWTY